jgi:tetratricopeptide (TPR) repeat protein
VTDDQLKAEATDAGSTAVASASLGERIRALRVAAGLTQTELAGDRFSKEYVSQIERGKTRPTRDTTSWLANRLGVDASLLESGVAGDVRSRAEAALARGEALLEASRHEEALDCLRGARASVGPTGVSEVEARLLSGEGWALTQLDRPGEAVELLQVARELLEGPGFDDVARAEVLFRLAVCLRKLGSVATAVGLLDEALELADRSDLPSETLRAAILAWRSRCRRHQRDLDPAREDGEQALAAARSVGGREAVADAHLEASLRAQQAGHWATSRTYAEHARALYRELEEQRAVGRLLQNLGGLHLLQGEPERAIEQLSAALAVAEEARSAADAADAHRSLAAVYLQIEDYDAADDHARRGLELLEAREDSVQDIGQSRIVLGRALMERGRLAEAETCFKAADSAFEQLGSASHRAGAWVALGDLASRRGDDREAARLYRSAAEALQDIRY